MGIHPTAIVDDAAEIADDVEIGPFCIVDARVSIGSGCKLLSHVHVHDYVTIGENNIFHQGCSVGDAPQDYSYSSDETTLVIGSSNTFREYVTIHRGTPKDRGTTTIGSNGFFMAYSHIAHDCEVGDHVLMTNCAQLAGHTQIQDHASLSAYVGVHQFCRVGRYAYIGAITIANMDIIPFALAVNGEKNRTTIAGPNLVGLKRQGFNKESIRAIRQAYKILFNSSLNTTQAVERMQNELGDVPEVEEIISFISEAKRGIAK